MTAISEDKRGGIGEMLRLAFPMVVSFACDTGMIFTDRVFLAKLGSEHMSAAMGGGLTVFMLMSFFLGLTGYTTALAAQYLGSGRKKRCPVVLSQALLVVAAAYPLVLLCRPLAHWYFIVTGLSDTQRILQNVYFDILIFGAVLSLARNALAAFFSGVGRTGIVMGSSVVTLSVNVVLNYILIFGKLGFPALGIRGAAYGTVLGNMSAVAILLSVYLGASYRRDFAVGKSWRFDRKVMGKLLRYGYPSGLELFLNMLAFSLIVFAFHSHSPVSAAAATIVFNWDMVTFVPLLGIEIGVTSLVGRYMGAGEIILAQKATRSGVKMGMAYSGFLMFLFAFFPEPLVRIFQPLDPGTVFPAAYPLAVVMVRLVALYVLAELIFVVYTGALRGAGDTFWAMCLSVTLHWVLVPVIYAILHVWQAGVINAWLALVGIFMAFSVFPYWRYRRGYWKSIRMVEPVEGIVSASPEGF